MNVPSLITYTHTFNEQNEITARQPNAIYYLPGGCASYLDMPLGRVDCGRRVKRVGRG